MPSFPQKRGGIISTLAMHAHGVWNPCFCETMVGLTETRTAHRTLIVRRLKGLEDIIPITSVHWHMQEKGRHRLWLSLLYRKSDKLSRMAFCYTGRKRARREHHTRPVTP